MFQSFIYETQNCSTVESCKALEFVHSYMEEECVSETTRALKSAGFVMVEMESEEISFDVIF